MFILLVKMVLKPCIFKCTFYGNVVSAKIFRQWVISYFYKSFVQGSGYDKKNVNDIIYKPIDMPFCLQTWKSCKNVQVSC